MTDNLKNEKTPNPVTEGASAASAPSIPTAATPGAPSYSQPAHVTPASTEDATDRHEVAEGVQARSSTDEERAERVNAAAEGQ